MKLNKPIEKRKAEAFDDLKELYFNFDWEKETTLKFVTEMGMILTVAQLDIQIKEKKWQLCENYMTN